MSMHQMDEVFENQAFFSSQYRTKSHGVFFQYDYAESQQDFIRKYPSSILRGLAGLKGWEWFIDENSLPNIRLTFYDQNLHVPVAPVLLPATSIDQCPKLRTPGIMGFVYFMSHEDMAALEKDQCLKGRHKIYYPITLQSKSINGAVASKLTLASLFLDMTSTRDGAVDVQNLNVRLHWSTALKRMQQTGIQPWYIQMVFSRLKGTKKDIEPFFVRPNVQNARVDPRVFRKQPLTTAVRIKQQQQLEQLRQQQQQEQQQKQQKQKQQQEQQASKRPSIKLSKQQKDAMIQQILRHGNIPVEQASMLGEPQKCLMIINYLRKRQESVQGREDEDSIQDDQVADQQEKQRQDAILNEIIHKQQIEVRKSEQSSRQDSRMPPPPLPTRRLSQSGQGQNGNGRFPPAPVNYPQHPNNVKRPASNSISNSSSVPDPKRRKTGNPIDPIRPAAAANSNGNGNGNGSGAQDAKRNPADIKRPASSPSANLSDAAEPKRKQAGRGRPRKNPVVLPVTNAANQNRNQNQNLVVRNEDANGNGKSDMRGGGKVQYANTKTNANANARGNSVTGSQVPVQNINGYANAMGNMAGNPMQNMNRNPKMMGIMIGNQVPNGNVNAMGNATGNDNNQAYPHVDTAAQMVSYFQPKVGVARAGDGRMQ
ncbi:hypothetical protein NHQ30_004223 [Ciborinia camelliae]|nr:hypothetical protein NHQ30_004223 [Ciborinia camelliae]